MDKPKQKTDLSYWQPYLSIVARLSVWIAAPVIIGAWFGKWLDKKFDTEPWLFLATVGFAFLISMIGLIKNTLAEFKKVSAISEKDNKASEKITNKEQE